MLIKLNWGNGGRELKPCGICYNYFVFCSWWQWYIRSPLCILRTQSSILSNVFILLFNIRNLDSNIFFLWCVDNSNIVHVISVLSLSEMVMHAHDLIACRMRSISLCLLMWSSLCFLSVWSLRQTKHRMLRRWKSLTTCFSLWWHEVLKVKIFSLTLVHLSFSWCCSASKRIRFITLYIPRFYLSW